MTEVGVVSHYLRESREGADSETDRIEKSTRIVQSIVDHLDDRGIKYFLNRSAADEMGVDGVRISEMDVDIVVTVGGDGTILRTIRRLPRPIPLLGINTGRVGFLAEIPPEEALGAIDAVLDEDDKPHGFETTERARLSVTVNGESYPPALNETVIVTSRPAKIMEFDVVHDSEHVKSVRADGIVVATPTGSTAYAMSAGGPIVHPTVGALVVVPLAPFRRDVSPWVLDLSKKTRITPTRVSKDAAVVVDGVEVTEVGSADTLEFGRAEEDASFVKTDKSFFEKVREKLS